MPAQPTDQQLACFMHARPDIRLFYTENGWDRTRADREILLDWWKPSNPEYQAANGNFGAKLAETGCGSSSSPAPGNGGGSTWDQLTSDPIAWAQAHPLETAVAALAIFLLLGRR